MKSKFTAKILMVLIAMSCYYQSTFMVYVTWGVLIVVALAIILALCGIIEFFKTEVEEEGCPVEIEEFNKKMIDLKKTFERDKTIQERIFSVISNSIILALFVYGGHIALACMFSVVSILTIPLKLKMIKLFKEM